MGGDTELHHLVQELGELFHEKPEYFYSLDLRVYLVPTKKSCTADFIAI